MRERHTPAAALLCAALAVLGSSSALAARGEQGTRMTGAQCEELWKKESAKFAASQDWRAFLERWRSFEKPCAGTGAYEARLAIAHAALGETASAARVLERVKRPGAFEPLVAFGKLQIAYFEAARRDADGAEVLVLMRRFEAFVRDHPEFREAYVTLGGLQTILGRHAEAIPNLEIAAKGTVNVAGALRNLVICYAAVGRHDDALGAADRAYGLWPGLSSDGEFLHAFANALEAQGERDKAETVRQLIRAKGLDETVRRDPPPGSSFD